MFKQNSADLVSANNFPVYPWQYKQWNYLLERWNQQKLPHALLLAGTNGIGKKTFADQFSQFLFCEYSSKKVHACGNCRSCHLFKAKSHPDFYLLMPENDSKIIRIEQIRELIKRLAQTSQQQQHMKIAVITPAESLAIAASNALLKTLEEPTPNTIIIILTQNPQIISATLRSRCQSIFFHLPELKKTQTWLIQQSKISEEQARLLLALADQAPLRALAIAGNETFLNQLQTFVSLISAGQKINCVKVANDLSKFIINDIITWWFAVVNDLLRSAFQQQQLFLDHFIKSSEQLQQLVNKINFANLFVFLDRLYAINKQLITAANLNQQLLLEDLLVEWIHIFAN